MFRSMLVKARSIKNEDMRKSIMSEVKTQFRQNQDVRDPQVIRMLMAEGRRSLKQIESIAEDSNSIAIDSSKATTALLDPVRADNQYEVGTGWPWERSSSS